MDKYSIIAQIQIDEADSEMLPIVVVPMLNEERYIAATCRSLGFGPRRASAETVLVLVDNGSSDGTRRIVERIRDESGADRVLLVHEAERGYVPARAAGVRAAMDHALRNRLSTDRILVLQADADTIYEPGYVDSMIAAAHLTGMGYMFEGASIPPRQSMDPCSRFRELEFSIDADLPVVSDEHDVVVDDKVSAYFLNDYLRWGGHRREYSSTSLRGELLAETMRLFIRARTGFGARVFRVEGALATTSSRRILREPALAFATAGFPRETNWSRKWLEAYSGPRSLDAFTIAGSAELHEAIAMRRRHTSALFQLLPRIVERQRTTIISQGNRNATSGSVLVPGKDSGGVSMGSGAAIWTAFNRAGIA